MKTSTMRVLTSAALVIVSAFFTQLQTAHAQWQSNGSNVYYNGGSVGIGTSNPFRLLHIANTGWDVDVNLGVSGRAPSILFSEEHTMPLTRWSKIGLATSYGDFVPTSQPGDFVVSSLTPGGNMLFVTNTYTTVEALRIANSGDVGIGTTNPTAKLHNNGTVRFENLPFGTGNVLVADADGNVYRSSQTARISAQEETNSGSGASDEIAALKEKINKLEEALQALQLQINPAKGSIDIKTSNSYQLELSPNPAGSTTTIRYNYPSFSNAAYINISDQSGRLVKRIDIKSASKSTVSLSVKDVAVSSGTYVCSLEVDGKIVASKQVIFIK